jgi:hypothetical protein
MPVISEGDRIVNPYKRPKDRYAYEQHCDDVEYVPQATYESELQIDYNYDAAEGGD